MARQLLSLPAREWLNEELLTSSATLYSAAALTTAGTLAGLPWWQGAAAVVALLAVVGWVVRSALRVFGGINGDVLGAVIEVGLGTLLVGLTVGIAS